jgi:transcriptional regulator with XRE-family HTH domain
MDETRSFLKEMGSRLTAARKHEGLSQVQLAKRVGVSQQIIANYETGSRHIPVGRLVRICDALGVGIADVVGRSETGPRKRGPHAVERLESSTLSKCMNGLDYSTIPVSQRPVGGAIHVSVLKWHNAIGLATCQVELVCRAYKPD